MNDFLNEIIRLISQDDVLISEHGYEELESDRLTVEDVTCNISQAIPVELYPNYHKGRCILVLQISSKGDPIHVLWGIPKGFKKPAVLITAYKPDPLRWDETLKIRLK